MKKYHEIEKIIFKNNELITQIDGKEYTFQLSDISPKLANASQIERDNYKISPSGYGIHWPSINEDLSIDGLMGIKHSPKTIKETALT
jgi:hypothetical protein|tara:strand:+ start:2903 stop:3166 length:264 start_codon:yes stop_codon:yes gene_type:complete